MIDLHEMVRAFALTLPGVANGLANFAGGKALFTSRPPPDDAPYPMGFVSPMMDFEDSSMVDAIRGQVVHYLSFYSVNDSPAAYRNVETMGFAAALGFNRADKTLFTMPMGWSLVMVTARGPQIAPVDDDKLIGRVVTLRFLVKQG